MSHSPFRRALTNAGWLLGGKGVGAVLSLVYLALATRSLGLDKFGQFTLILSTAQAVSGIVGFQSWQIVIRFGVGLLDGGRRDALGRLLRLLILLDLAAALVGCALAAITITLLAKHFGWSADFAREALAFCFVVLLTIRSTAVGILRLHGRFDVGAMADAVTPIVRCAGAVAAVLVGASVSGFLIAWAAAEVATAAAYWVMAYRTDSSFVGSLRLVRAVPDAHPGLGRFALGVNLNATLATAGKQLLIVLVGIVAGPAAAGVYRLAFQLSQGVTRLADMFSKAIFPEFTRAHTGEGGELRTLYGQALRLALPTAGIICILAPIVSGPILALVGGKAFAGAAGVLILLSFATALEVMNVAFEPLLLSAGQSGTVLRIRLAATAILFVVAGATLGRFGPIAAAGASLLASITALTGFAAKTRKIVTMTSAGPR